METKKEFKLTEADLKYILGNIYLINKNISELPKGSQEQGEHMFILGSFVRMLAPVIPMFLDIEPSSEPFFHSVLQFMIKADEESKKVQPEVKAD